MKNFFNAAIFRVQLLAAVVRYKWQTRAPRVEAVSLVLHPYTNELCVTVRVGGVERIAIHTQIRGGAAFDAYEANGETLRAGPIFPSVENSVAQLRARGL